MSDIQCITNNSILNTLLNNYKDHFICICRDYVCNSVMPSQVLQVVSKITTCGTEGNCLPSL